MGKKSKLKTIKLILAFIMLISLAAVLFSPYGKSKDFPYKLVKHSISINASPERVFQYLGNSNNAKDWSVFVDHISAINADSFPDGVVGSRRRCFAQADERGTLWDELITEVIPNIKRQLTIYNLQGFPMTADHLATEQLYERINPNKCRLTFTVFFKDQVPSFFESLKMYIGAYRIKSIFAKNMLNIKKFIEHENPN